MPNYIRTVSSHQSFTVPWGAVYKADRNGQTTDPNPLFGRGTDPWKLFSCTVSLTRYWSISSAQIVITRPILSAEDRKIDLLSELGLAPEDAIIINLGYADRPLSDNVIDSDRVFYGYVDTIKASGNKRSFKVTISCRDSLRFLQDNKFSGQIYTADGLVTSHNENFSQFKQGLANPLDPEEVDNALRSAPNGVSVSISDRVESSPLTKEKIMAWLIYAGSNGGCLPGVLIDNDQNADNFSDPAIERSSRLISTPADVLGGGIQGFNIMNRFPLEVIKHIGSLEAEPRELYADVSTGRICWRKRRTFNKDNPKTLAYLVSAPDGTPPNVISQDLDWSTVGTISELIVINPEADLNSNGNPALGSSGVLNISGRLPDDRFFKDDIPLAYPGISSFTCRTRFIFDDTITPEDTNNAQKMIDAMFNIWGKDMRAGTAIIPGDPHLKPGDALQLYNFGFYDYDGPMGVLFRAEAIMQKLTATGANKGFLTSVAFAEADEPRQDIIQKTKNAIGSANFYSKTDHAGEVDQGTKGIIGDSIDPTSFDSSESP